MVMKGEEGRARTHTHTAPLTTVNRPIYAHLLRAQKDTWENRTKPENTQHTDGANLYAGK